MARVRISRQGFITGKLSLEAQANTQADVYNFGLDMCENFAIKPLGGAYKRSGTHLLSLLKKPDGDGNLSNYKFIRFFEYYYKGEKILVFLTDGINSKTVFGYLREDGSYGSLYLIEDYLTDEGAGFEFGIHINTEEELNAISAWSFDNKFMLIIPKAKIIYDDAHIYDEYGSFFSFSFSLDEKDKLIHQSHQYWDSEPLMSSELGDQLLLCCYNEVILAGHVVSGVPPWSSFRNSNLRIYAQILDKDGNRYNNPSVENMVRKDSWDGLGNYNELNVLFDR